MKFFKYHSNDAISLCFFFLSSKIFSRIGEKRIGIRLKMVRMSLGNDDAIRLTFNQVNPVPKLASERTNESIETAVCGESAKIHRIILHFVILTNDKPITDDIFKHENKNTTVNDRSSSSIKFLT